MRCHEIGSRSGSITRALSITATAVCNPEPDPDPRRPCTLACRARSRAAVPVINRARVDVIRFPSHFCRSHDRYGAGGRGYPRIGDDVRADRRTRGVSRALPANIVIGRAKQYASCVNSRVSSFAPTEGQGGILQRPW
jgi:hypothetical protein